MFALKKIFSGKWLYILICVLLGTTAFTRDGLMHQLAEKTQNKLTAFHSIEPESMKIRKCEINISDEGFLRYRKTYISGKQEYYSLNLSRLKSIDYVGNTRSGTFIIKTLEDDVIVQTYNDRNGNVDSMSVQLGISFDKIEPEDLQDLHQDMFEMKRLLRAY